MCNMCDLKLTICVASHEFYVTSQHLVKTSQDCIHYITSTPFLTSDPLYDMTYTLLVTSQPLLLCRTPTMFLTFYSVYMTSQPRFMTSQHSIYYMSIITHMKLIISEGTSNVFLSLHPDYRSYNPHCIYDNTGTICMTSYEYI